MSFAIGLVSELIKAPQLGHWHIVIHILIYNKKAWGQRLLHEDKGDAQIFTYCHVDWARSLADKHSTTRHCVFSGGNIISWKGKKQNVVTQSSLEYRAMGITHLWIWWIKQFLQEMKFCEIQRMRMYFDNQTTIHIVSNRYSMREPNASKFVVKYFKKSFVQGNLHEICLCQFQWHWSTCKCFD